MPDYREVWGEGFKFKVVPMDFRQIWILRKWPYFSGKQIDLVLYTKPYWERYLDCTRLEFNWDLTNVATKEIIKNGSGVLSKGYPNDKYLTGLIFLPYLAGKGQEFALKIEATCGDEFILNKKEEIFTFELHGSDSVFMIVMGAIIGTVITLFLQWLLPWIISMVSIK